MILGVIPARGQSKRLPNKNLMNLGGDSLLCRAIRSARESRLLAESVVLTDYDAIRRAAISLGARVGIFVGGSTPFKLETMPAWGELAREIGCWLHVGRVNSGRRIRDCHAA